jgi:hypothetical protein
MRFLAFYGIFLCVLIVISARASVLEDSSKAYFYDGARSFLSHQVLGSSCSHFRSLRNEIPCNPALLSIQDEQEEIQFFEDSILGLNLNFGKDYETLYKNRELFAEEDKYRLAQSLLSEEKPISFQGSAVLWLRMPYFAVWYQPIRWTYFSSVRNSSYPDIAVHAMQESQLGTQWGGKVGKGWQFGVQARIVDRKFIHEEFNLFDAIPNLENYLQVKSQKLILVEPGFAYRLSGDEWTDYWQPMLSVNLTQIGWSNEKYEFVPLTPVSDLGLSVLPKVSYGELELGINMRATSEVKQDRTARLGAQYRLGVASFLAGYDRDQWALGMSSAYKSVSAGIMYQRRELSDFRGEKFHEDSASVEFRLML